MKSKWVNSGPKTEKITLVQQRIGPKATVYFNGVKIGYCNPIVVEKINLNKN